MPATDEAPTVIYFAPPSVVGDAIRAALPEGWHYECLSKSADESEKLTKIARAASWFIAE